MLRLHLILPWPPSLNHYWRYTPKGVLISRAGREYRKKVYSSTFDPDMTRLRFDTNDRIACVVLAFPPDRRQRDLDNTLKALLDALQKAGIYVSDNQIDDLRICRREVQSPGRLEVILEEIVK